VHLCNYGQSETAMLREDQPPDTVSTWVEGTELYYGTQ
jgi:hypothetical protein